MLSRCRSNFSVEAESLLNKQVNMESSAEQFYLSMYSACASEGLQGLSKYFLNASKEENGHARKFLDYLILRGGTPEFYPIVGAKSKEAIGSPLDMLNDALELEKSVHNSLLEIAGIASTSGDYHLEEFIENEFLREQIRDIKKIADMISQLDRCGDGLGLFIWDQELLKKLD
jgi:ferritin heavy chain